MNLKILLPSEIFMNQEVSKIVAEADNGFFCLLEHHVDFVASLVPGIFSFEKKNHSEEILAIDVGILVKHGPNVLVSSRNAILGRDLGKLKQVVEEQFQELDEREKKARSAAAKLEADILRRFIELK